MSYQVLDGVSREILAVAQLDPLIHGLLMHFALAPVHDRSTEGTWHPFRSCDLASFCGGFGFSSGWDLSRSGLDPKGS